MSENYNIEDLKSIMAQLRNPEGGCPWDLSKDFKSIAPYTIEEAYEVVDAIDRGDMDDLRDELGDLLFQVIFHAQLAKEQASFMFDDVVHTLSEKLIRRHPHVFGDEKLATDQEIRQMWERVKDEEREAKAPHKTIKPATYFDDIPLGLPALSRAVKLQKKAAKVGFDWPSVAPVIEKIEEELLEVKEAILLAEQAATEKGLPLTEIDQTAKSKVSEEIGDLLFVMANLARHLHIDPEQAARSANVKFCRRFAHIESELAAKNVKLADSSLEEMDALWDDAKIHGL